MTADPLLLSPLFREGGAAPWMPILKPVIEQLPNAATFIGVNRSKKIVPLRELTFQALEPHPPEKWRVVIFGQSPFPRTESANGIALFDSAFKTWNDQRLEWVATIRSMIRVALMWKHKIPNTASIDEMRELLQEHKVVNPPEWFQSMLAQGVLFLNAALTLSIDKSLPVEEHTAFWRPVIEVILEAIFQAHAQLESAQDRGLVFAWWGNHARALRPVVDKLSQQFPSVKALHVTHYHPAARKDEFCTGRNAFGDINRALVSLKQAPINWLCTEGWQNSSQVPTDKETAEKMGEFIKRAVELHNYYLARLQGVELEQVKKQLSPIYGVFKSPVVSFGQALLPVVSLVPQLADFAKSSVKFGREKQPLSTEGLTAHEIAAIYLYTRESAFFRKLNEALRDPDRTKITPFVPYLRLLLSALGRLPRSKEQLWRGVKENLLPQYPKGSRVVWWGVSSCTTKKDIAHNYLWAAGGTLFQVNALSAVSVKKYSAFITEEELIIPPGTTFDVTHIEHNPHGASIVTLKESTVARLVS